MKIDCCALDCFYNTRKVDKFMHGECGASHVTINSKGSCLDYDVHDIEDYKMLTKGKTPPDLKKRIVPGREASVDDWSAVQKERFNRACQKFNYVPD